MKTVLYTTLALLAFAGNSILCRLALGEGAIDAASFTIIRLLSATFVLAVIMRATQSRSTVTSRGSWKASFMLFLYAVTFSYAYVSLETGIGALILFGSVQIAMIVAGLRSGHRFNYFECLGLIVAFCGFVYLVMPGVAAPSLVGFILMSLAGIAWGLYTLAGKGSVSPLHDTAFNFIRTLPLVFILLVVTIQHATTSPQGILLALLSGALASGMGYTLWYVALAGLSAIQAAVVQLLVPVVAAVGGVVLSNEIFSYRLGLSSIIIITGILVVILAGYYSEKKTPL